MVNQALTQNVVVHFGEISTRGRNKPYFVRRLQQNIVESVNHICETKAEIFDNRILLEVQDGCVPRVLDSLSRVFGVAWFAAAELTPLNYSDIRNRAVSILGRLKNTGSATFGIRARRSNKNWEYTSTELASKLGAEVSSTTGLKVDLTKPDVQLYVDIVRNAAILYTSKVMGPRGLPVGVSGKVVHLLSGGVDSSVAAWLLMKRGCKPVSVHFYAAPSTEEVLNSKMPKILRYFSQYCGRSDLLLIPFSPYHVTTMKVSSEYEPVLFRYFMRTVAEKLASKTKALAISTGDSLAQVASQTLENLGAFDHGSSLPVLRPLLTYDKQEIVEFAKKIGVYDLCGAKYKDCCSMISTHSKTRVGVEEVRQLAVKVGFEQLVKKTLALSWVLSYFPAQTVYKLSTLDEYFEGVEGQTCEIKDSTQS